LLPFDNTNLPASATPYLSKKEQGLPVYCIKSKSLTIAFILLIINVLSIFNLSAQSNIDSLEAILPKSKGHERLEIINGLFVHYLESANLKKALFYTEMLKKQAYDMQDTIWMIRSHNASGYVLLTEGLLNESLEELQKGRLMTYNHDKRPAAIEYTRQRKYILNNIGTAYIRLANFDKALETNFESLRIREADRDTTGIAVSLNNIGVVYREMGDVENAFSYFGQSYELMVAGKIEDEIELRLVSLAYASNDLELYAEAKEYVQNAFKRCKNKCDERIIGLANHAYGYALMKTGSLQEAEKYFLKAAEIFKKIDDTDQISELTALAELKIEQNDLNRALAYLQESQEMAEEVDIIKFQLNNFKLYATVYRLLKDYRLASDYQLKYQELYEKIFSGDLIKNVARIQARYQEEENLATIQRQGTELKIKQELIRAKENQVIFFTIVSILVIVLVFILWRFNLAQRKSNQELMAAKSTIEEKNNALIEINRTLDQRIMDKTQELVTANISLQKSNDELDNFIYKTSHDIRGPLASLKGIASLALLESKDEEVTRYIKMLDETAEGLIKILTRLVSISQITNAKLAPVEIDFGLLINDVLAIQKKRGLPNQMRIEHEVAPELTLISDRTLLSIVLENLIDNAIKFQNTSGRVEPVVRMYVAQDANNIQIRVIDNGIGIDKISADKIFQMFVRASERSETGGLGLYLSRLAVEKLGGEISLHITEEKWTEFRVNLPGDLNQIVEERKQAEIQREIEKVIVAKKNQTD
jgi:signal transduction histidine kinase